MDLEEYYAVTSLFQEWLRHYVAIMAAQGIKPTMQNRPDDRLRQLYQLLENHDFIRPLSLESVAGCVGLSVVHANRLFRRQFGVSMRRFYEERRHASAVYALTKTTLLIKEVAYQLGFKSISSFSHWFNKREGCSPHEYRETHKAK